MRSGWPSAGAVDSWLLIGKVELAVMAVVIFRASSVRFRQKKIPADRDVFFLLGALMIDKKQASLMANHKSKSSRNSLDGG